MHGNPLLDGKRCELDKLPGSVVIFSSPEIKFVQIDGKKQLVTSLTVLFPDVFAAVHHFYEGSPQCRHQSGCLTAESINVSN